MQAYMRTYFLCRVSIDKSFYLPNNIKDEKKQPVFYCSVIITSNLLNTKKKKHITLSDI